MEKRLILYEKRQADGRGLLESRKLSFRKLNNSILFTLNDSQYFFVSYHFCEKIKQERRDKVIIRPNNHILNQIVRYADNDSITGYLVIDISGGDAISTMHLVDAVIIVLKEVDIGLKYFFEAFCFKIVDDEKHKEFVLDSDLDTQKEVILVKAGKTDIFLLDCIGEIETNMLNTIVESCFDV